MSTMTAFFNFISVNLKRLLHYLPHILLSVVLLFLVTCTAGTYIAKHLYKESEFSAVSIGYYLPEDDNVDLNTLGIHMLEELDGMQQTVQLQQIPTKEQGYEMLQNREILYFIIVPEHFFSGIMDSTNPPLDIVVYDNTSFSSYVINELFMSYAGLLGNAQAGIYSGLDTTRAHEFSEEQIQELSDRVNLVYLDRVMNKENYVERKHAESAGGVTLLEHYIALAIILSLCFTAFVLIPYLQGNRNGVSECMKLYHINTLHILLANIISTFAALFIAYLPCYIGVSVYKHAIHPFGLIRIIPALVLIAILISFIATFTKNTFSANICLLVVVLILAYCGGGLLPSAMLPKIIRAISHFLPGNYVMNTFCHALFL